MSAPESIVLVRRQPTAEIVLNDRARHNVLTRVMQDELSRVLADLQRDPDVLVAILRGSGQDAFSAGGDIGELAPESPGAAANLWTTLERFEKPLLAQIDGYCLGGGLLLALLADIRVCSDRSSFAIPAARLGVGYGAELIAPLAAAVGPAWAAEILFTGRRLTAVEALAAGLVTRIEAPDDLPEVVDRLATQIAANAPLTVQGCKVALRAISTRDGESYFERAAELAQAAWRSADFEEGRRAFADHREARFTGR
jgi:enoyl-CoA hydratase